MSRLFERLARQAMGRPRGVVHTIARLPYQAAPELQETDQAQTAPVPQKAGQTSNQVPITAPAAITLTATDAQAQKGSEQVLPKAGPRLSPDPEPTRPATASPAPLLPKSSERVTSASAAPLARVRYQGQEPLADAAQPAKGKKSVTTIQAQQSVLHADLTAIEALPARNTNDQTHRPDQAATRLPENLLPSLAPQQERSRQSLPAVENDPESSTEVHVHIGRIEVTALQSTPAIKRPGKRGVQPMSLDDYLARRGRGES